MEFDVLVEHFKLEREKIASTPMPFFPPHLICFTADDEVLCSVTAPRPSPTAISGLLAILPVLRPDRMFLVLEVFVRDQPSDVPIGDDPEATPALVMFHVERGGSTQTQIEAFQVLDDGSPQWVPHNQELSIVPLLLGAIRQMEEAEVTNSVKEVFNWYHLNNYAIRLDPKLLDD